MARMIRFFPVIIKLIISPSGTAAIIVIKNSETVQPRPLHNTFVTDRINSINYPTPRTVKRKYEFLIQITYSKNITSSEKLIVKQYTSHTIYLSFLACLINRHLKNPNAGFCIDIYLYLNYPVQAYNGRIPHQRPARLFFRP